MRNRKRLSAALSLGLLTAGLAVAGAATASAVVTPDITGPHGCAVTLPNGWSGNSTCRYGPGQQRLNLTCTDGVTGNTEHSYGPWVQWYQTSNATCGNSSRYTVTYFVVEAKS